ncbi:MAG: response regulator [Cytophagaceae bacterium]
MKKPQKFSRVMIVDDNDLDVLILKHMLKVNNFSDSVITFNFPENAFFYLSELHKNEASEKFPQIIFLDMNMPGMSGMEFIEKFNKAFSESVSSVCKIIGVSSGDAGKYKSELSKFSNVSRFIAKPILDKDLNF